MTDQESHTVDSSTLKRAKSAREGMAGDDATRSCKCSCNVLKGGRGRARAARHSEDNEDGLEKGKVVHFTRLPGSFLFQG